MKSSSGAKRDDFQVERTLENDREQMDYSNNAVGKAIGWSSLLE